MSNKSNCNCDYLDRQIKCLRTVQDNNTAWTFKLARELRVLKIAIFWLIFIDIIFAILIYPWVA